MKQKVANGNGNGNGKRTLWIIISCGISALLFMGSAIMGYTTIVKDYYLYKSKTDNNAHYITVLQSQIQNDIGQYQTKVLQQIDNLQKEEDIIKTKIANILAKLVEILAYQDIIRKELKDVAEGKLNIIEFWREMSALKDRVEYLERIHRK